MDNSESLLLHALVSYADSCTLPALTASCPYFLNGPEGPTCGEECRDLISNRGGGNREVIQARAGGGLIMHGRSIPFKVISGKQDFDAAQFYLKQRELPVSSQGIPSLLLLLRAILIAHIVDGEPKRLVFALDVWGELSRRLGDMDAVYVGGLAPHMADAAVARAVAELVQQHGESSPVSEFSDLTERRTWLRAAEVAHVTRSANVSRRHSRDRIDTASPSLFPGLANSKVIPVSLAASPLFQFIISMEFHYLVECWFERLVDHDLSAALSGQPPPSSVFAALSGRQPTNDKGLWLWERFTETSVENWSYTSYLHEWAWVQEGDAAQCDRRALAERVIPAETLSHLAMTKASHTHRNQSQLRLGFQHEPFSNRASQLLIDGNWQEACQLFEGLVELLPGDPDVWNNLGFCQLANDPVIALHALNRASLLSSETFYLYEANLILALHLTGDDDSAIGRATEALRSVDHIEYRDVFVWQHPSEDGDELELVKHESPTLYIETLRSHIQEGKCDSRDAVH